MAEPADHRQQAARRDAEPRRVDRDHPLASSTPMGKAQTVERIGEAMRTGGREGAGRLTIKRVGALLGCGRNTASKLLTNPELLDRRQALRLCDVLGRPMEWLRDGDDGASVDEYTNDLDIVAALYDDLDARGKRAVWQVLVEIAGVGAVDDAMRGERGDLADVHGASQEPDAQGSSGVGAAFGE